MRHGYAQGRSPKQKAYHQQVAKQRFVTPKRIATLPRTSWWTKPDFYTNAREEAVRMNAVSTSYEKSKD